MSAPFSYPLPPPPPPKAAAEPGYGGDSYQGQSNRGGGGGFRGRGRGRGNSQRGYTSGGYNAYPHQDYSGGAAGYPQQQPMTGQPVYPQGYPQQQQPQSYPPQQHQGYTQESYQQYMQQYYPQTADPASAYQQPYAYQNQGYGQAPYDPSSQYPSQTGYGYIAPSWPLPPHSQGSPPPMGPPLRMGFGIDHGQNQHSSNYQMPVHGTSYDNKRKREGNFSSRGTSNNGRYQKGNHFNARPQKKPKVEAAPAVPSFGAPLPAQASLAKSTGSDAPNAAKNKNKKKRKVNQLGLTPAGEEHESSEEEVDEEELFASLGGPLQFEYKGKTSVLGTSADIASWIEERKAKFPTRAKIEAKQAELQQRRQEQVDARRKAQTEARKAAKKVQAEANNATLELQAEDVEPAPDEAKNGRKADDKTQKSLERHLAKAEKLRKKLEKSQARVDKAAAVLATGLQPESELSAVTKEAPDGGDNDVVPTEEHDVENIPDAMSRETLDTSKGPLEALEAALDASLAASAIPQAASTTKADKPNGAPPPGNANPQPPPPTLSQIPVSDSASNTDIPTSDSSSDSSSDDDDDDDEDATSSDSSPEEASAKANGPMRVAPPPKGKRDNAKPTPVCRFFLSKGYCAAGDQCRFRHELPEHSKPGAAAERVNKREKKQQQQPTDDSYPENKVRKTLFQRLVDQEQAAEDRAVLRAIKYLGQHGVLQGKPPRADPGGGAGKTSLT